MPAILSVVLLAVFMLLLFSITGMYLFMGKFYRCNNEDASGEVDCIGIVSAGLAEHDVEVGDPLSFMVPQVWDNPGYSFDNVFAGILVLYEMTSLEGYVNVIFSGIDVTDVGMQPIQDNNPQYAFFFVLFICAVCYFILNLAIGVIIEKYNQMSGRGLLTDEQKVLKDNMLAIYTQDDPTPVQCPHHSFRAFCFKLVNNKWFEYCVFTCILVNSTLEATLYYHMHEIHFEILDYANIAFISLFSIELTLRLVAVFPSRFFLNSWNTFDFVVVSTGLLAMLLSVSGLLAENYLSSIRALRLLLLTRIVKRAKGVRLMVMTLAVSLPALLNVAALLIMLFFLYGIVGMQVFGNVKFGQQIGSHANFRNVGNSMLLMFRVITGENWNLVMADCQVQEPECTNFETTGVDGYYLPNDCGSKYGAVIFFVSFYALGTYTVMNLFIAKSAISEELLADYKKKWFKLSLKHVARRVAREPRTVFDAKFLSGRFLPRRLIKHFLLDLGKPLGLASFDQIGQRQYENVMQHLVLVPQRGVSYIHMQMILVQLHAGLNPLPLDEFIGKTEELEHLKRHSAAIVIASASRGRLQRKKMDQVKVLRGHNLRPMELSGASDSMVTIKYGEHEFSTTNCNYDNDASTVTLDPLWNQEFYFNRLPNLPISVTVHQSGSSSSLFNFLSIQNEEEQVFMGRSVVETESLELDKPVTGAAWLFDEAFLMRCLGAVVCDLVDLGDHETKIYNEMAVRIHKGRNLRAMDCSICFAPPTSDPFVELRHGSAMSATSVRRQTVEYDSEGQLKPLEFKVKDWDLMGEDELIGSASIKLASTGSVFGRQWVELLNGEGQCTGEIEVQVDWRDTKFGRLGLELAWRSKIHSTIVGRLAVKVIQARLFLDSSSDPLVRLSHGRQRKHTSTCWTTLTPRWDEDFKFAYDRAQPLVVTVEDFDLSGNDFMGQVKIPLDTVLFKSVPLRQWFKLTAMDGSTDADYGEVEVEIMWKEHYSVEDPSDQGVSALEDLPTSDKDRMDLRFVDGSGSFVD